MMGDMPMVEPGEEEVLCLQMVVGFRDSIGMFLFDGWNGGRKNGGNFGYYFATLVFVATLAFIVEAIPLIRSKFFSPKKPINNPEYSSIPRSSQKATPSSFESHDATQVSLCLHLGDTLLQLIAKICMYLLMLAVMSYNFGVILTASFALPLGNFLVSIIQDREYI